MPSPLARRQRLRFCAFFAIALALVALAFAKTLPYASFLMENASAGTREADPTHEFSIGSVRWETDQFSQAASLAPFRRFFLQKCAGTIGTRAAMCLSQSLDHTIPFGTPNHEFFERDYDPAANLQAHLAGKPGHCLNRSAMLATTLLSVGIPARVASFSPKFGYGGHTVVEVWSGRRWTVVDPTVVGLVGFSQPASAAEIKKQPGSLRLFSASGAVLRDNYPLAASVASGELVYPEPWLYTRIGPRFSFWPFRGRFIQAGTEGWRFSAPLLFCRIAFVLGVYVSSCLLIGLRISSYRLQVAKPPQSVPATDERDLELKVG